MFDPEERYQKDVTKTFKCLDFFLDKQYGERCTDYEPMCIVCRVWTKRDELRELVS